MTLDIEPEKHLWQAVVYKAVLDATADNPHGQENSDAKRAADRWLRGGGKDFRMVCSLAEIDPDWIREAYVGGRVNPELLRAAEKEAA